MNDADIKELIIKTSKNEANIMSTQKALDAHVMDCMGERREIRGDIKSIRKTLISIGITIMVKLLAIIGVILWYFFTYFWKVSVGP